MENLRSSGVHRATPSPSSASGVIPRPPFPILYPASRTLPAAYYGASVSLLANQLFGDLFLNYCWHLPMSGYKNANGEAFTNYGWFVCLWVLLIPFQYGYHISALNQIKAVLTCEGDYGQLPADNSAFPTCIPMSNFVFSFVTAIFTVGGLLGSLVANIVMNQYGRKGASKATAFLLAVGAGIMSMSASVTSLSFGRFLIGVGSGLGICVGPIYVAEIAPSKISGNVGVLTQLGIVLGIMITQIAGFRFATPSEWRLVLFLSSFIGLVQFLTSYLVVETPTWFDIKGRPEDVQITSKRLWRVSTSTPSARPDDENPLLNDSHDRRPDPQTNTATVMQLFLKQELHKPLMIVCFGMLSQQVSGINAVLYYSNEILSKSLPEWGPYVSLGITVVNVIMTFPPIILIERVGRKQLLSLSVLGAVVSLVAVGFGLDAGFTNLASVATLTFVMSFAIGLGPIPFVLIPEVSPPYAVSALSSIALSLNWIANFFVGLIFLPLRSFLSSGDPTKEGRVFYVFVVILLASSLVLFKVYRG